LSAALKKGELRDKAYEQMVETTTQLNTPGIALAQLPAVHAMTDVTGFGLLGHLHEICRGSNLHADIRFDALPILSAARHLAQDGYATGALRAQLDERRAVYRVAAIDAGLAERNC
jgi:selenide,water dikinase